MKEDIAILTDDSFAILRKETRKLEIHKHDISMYQHIWMIAEKAIEYGVFNIWVTPYTHISGMFTKQFLDKSDVKIKGKRPNTNEYTYLEYVNLYKSGTKDIKFTIPEFNYLWKLEQYEDVSPNDLALMLYELREKLPISLYNAPTNIGIRLLEWLTTNANKEWIKPCETPISEEIPLASNLVWKKKRVDKPKKYLHVVDKNGAYLSSYQSCLVGEGNAKHYNHIVFNKQVGVFRVSLSGTSIYDGIDLPLPYAVNDSWLWTQEVKISQMLGYDIQVHECYIWEKAHYTFREWAKFIWNTRQELKQEYEEKHKFGTMLAYDTIKNIYTETGGRLAYRHDTKENDKNNTKDTYKRDDWYSMIVADTRLKVLYQIDKFIKQGFYPIMVVTDALYYLSDEKDINIALPTMLDRQNELGGYKKKYSVEWNLVEEAFNSGVNAGTIAETLNRLKEEGVTF